MLNIPSELKVGAHVYRVLLDTCEGRDCAGLTDRQKGVINLDTSFPETQVEATFFHEVFHALNSELEHALLDSLSEQMYAVLKLNHLLNETPLRT